MKFIFLILISIFFLGCSLAPTNMTNTGRSLGMGNSQLQLTSTTPGFIYEHGYLNKFDMGFGLEEQIGPVANIYAKYAFINHPDDGFSFAEIVGGGLGISFGNARSLYFAPVFSYRHKWLEVFMSYRINYVKWSNNLTSSEQKDVISFIPHDTCFQYHQMDLGLNFLGEKWSSSVGGKFFMFEHKASGMPFLNIGYKF